MDGYCSDECATSMAGGLQILLYPKADPSARGAPAPGKHEVPGQSPAGRFDPPVYSSSDARTSCGGLHTVDRVRTRAINAGQDEAVNGAQGRGPWRISPSAPRRPVETGEFGRRRERSIPKRTLYGDRISLTERGLSPSPPAGGGDGPSSCIGRPWTGCPSTPAGCPSSHVGMADACHSAFSLSICALAGNTEAAWSAC
jgi:hypothetical protein